MYVTTSSTVWLGWRGTSNDWKAPCAPRSEEHTSELQSQSNLVCRLLLEKKKKKQNARVRKRAAQQRDKSGDQLPQAGEIDQVTDRSQIQTTAFIQLVMIH